MVNNECVCQQGADHAWVNVQPFGRGTLPPQHVPIGKQFFCNGMSHLASYVPLSLTCIPVGIFSRISKAIIPQSRRSVVR